MILNERGISVDWNTFHMSSIRDERHTCDAHAGCPTRSGQFYACTHDGCGVIGCEHHTYACECCETVVCRTHARPIDGMVVCATCEAEIAGRAA